MLNRVLVYAEAVDVATEGAVWYARTISGGPFAALHVPGKHSDTGIQARWFDLTGGEIRLDVRPAGADPVEQVVGAVRRLREEEDAIVTVVVPEQYRKRSLVAAAHRSQFRLKLKLLNEPETVVADVPAVTQQRRPEGKDPKRLVVRILVGKLDAATRRAVEYARLLGVDDTVVVRFGDHEWSPDELDLPVDGEHVGAGGEKLLDYIRELTADGATAVNVVLAERLRGGAQQLRSPRTLAIKRSLLFEPHVILSSVPYRD